jgi:hypothetical protein
MSGSVIKSAITVINLESIELSKDATGKTRDDRHLLQQSKDLLELRFNLIPDRRIKFLNEDKSSFIATTDTEKAWGNYAEKTSTSASGSIRLDAPINPTKTSSEKNYKESIENLDSVANALGIEPGEINPAFIEEFHRLGGSSGIGLKAGEANIDKSFNPLSTIARLKNGLEVSSLFSFFKVADIKDSKLRDYASSLQKNNQWGAYSRAFDDLFKHALINDGSNPEQNKEQMSPRISTYIAQTAKLINDAIDSSGKLIDPKNRALAASFIATHFSVDDIAEKLGFNSDTIKKHQEGDKSFLLSEALLENPEILENQEKMGILQDHLTSLTKENYDDTLSHFAQNYDGNGDKLSNIKSGMNDLLQNKYQDIVMKLNDGTMPSSAEISNFMKEAGYQIGSKDYHKIGNSEIAAQTYLNLKAIEHDYNLLLKDGKLTDENRMYRAAQTNLRLTPTAAADDNGAFDEVNSGRNTMAVAGMNRDLVGNIAVPFVNKDQVGEILKKMEALGIKLSSIDISLHGYQQGTSEFSVNDKMLLTKLADRMADGGEILYNSCLTGRGTEKGDKNLATETLLTAAKDKGLKVHAADNETIGYLEDTVYDAFSGKIANTPRKLDGKVGGYTIQEGGIEEISNKEDTSEQQLLAIAKSQKGQEG